MDESDWQTCDEHEAVFPRHADCPYCRIAELQAQLDAVRTIVYDYVSSKGRMTSAQAITLIRREVLPPQALGENK